MSQNHKRDMIDLSYYNQRDTFYYWNMYLIFDSETSLQLHHIGLENLIILFRLSKKLTLQNKQSNNYCTTNNSLKNKRSDIICKWSIYVSSENTKATVQYDIVEIIWSKQQLVWDSLQETINVKCINEQIKL